MRSSKTRKRKFLKSDATSRIPDRFHVAFIMDGNGRWAAHRGLARKFGHRQGVKTMLNLLEYAYSIGIYAVTVYAFSTENRNRPQEEIDALMALCRKYFSREFLHLTQKGIRVKILGDVTYFPQDVREMIQKIEETDIPNPVGICNVAFNYGGRDEIVRAVNKAVSMAKEVDEHSFADLLYTADLPDPDVIVRTGGEKRLSNFLLYQAAYSELFFTDTLWPDFGKEEFVGILEEFFKRTRRYGKV